MTSDLIPLPGFKFRLERSATGHVHTPWFSVDDHLLARPETYAYMGQPAFVEAAKRAFMQALEITDYSDVIVSSYQHPAELSPKYRLGTKKPIAWTPPPVKIKDPTAIDI